MAEFLLHHYELSPFSEKVRKIFGAKNMAWVAVEQPNIMPKPDLVALTGGYRRIPVLQIGAHIYCDTALIVEEVERRQPDPPLTPPDLLPMAEMSADWIDHRIFGYAAMAAIGELLPTLPKEFLEDRAKMNPSSAAARATPDGPTHAREQLRQACAMLDRQLAQSAYLLGARFTLADASAFHVVNFAGFAPSVNEMLGGFENLSAWRQRVADMGHGTRSEKDSQAALEIARTAEIDTTPPPDAVTDERLQAGQAVVIQANDYGQETTEGEIVWLRANEIAVRRSDDAVGEVMVHYPRVGYRITAA